MMNDKAHISYHTAKRLLIDLIKNNDFSGDEDVLKLFHSILGEQPCSGCFDDDALSRIIIDREARIFLPDYSSKEVKMPYLPKTVFLFFLLHPDGVEFKSLCNYRQELYDIYQMVAIKKNIEADKIRQVLGNLVEPVNNRIYETCSIIRKTLLNIVPAPCIGLYCITGKRGGVHHILLERELIVIEHEKLERLMEK